MSFFQSSALRRCLFIAVCSTSMVDLAAGCSLISDFKQFKFSDHDAGATTPDGGGADVAGAGRAGNGGQAGAAKQAGSGGRAGSSGQAGSSGGAAVAAGGGGTGEVAGSAADGGADAGMPIDPLCAALMCDANNNPATCNIQDVAAGPKASCKCNHGFHDVYGDGTLCTDVNECASGVTCQNDSTCVNMPGTYKCQCNLGFVADPLQSGMCIAACAAKLPSCDPNALCMERQGVASCRCPAGYVDVKGDGTACDKDVACMLLNCDPMALCDSSIAAACVCPAGYTDVNGNGSKCMDIDECATANGGCSPKATCKNNNGGFLCECLPGYAGDGFSCNDLDECATPSDNNCAPSPIGQCTNTAGSFTCACKPGFTDNDPSAPGTSCGDLNECALGTATCATDAVCTNAVGGFTCACKPGYTGDGMTCTNIDECATNNGGCPSTCTDTPGSYTCGCSAGYKKDDSGVCQDVNECTAGTANCSVNAQCNNTVGAFSCTCNSGYSDVNGNGTACVDIDECQTHTSNCSANAQCMNRPGAFSCTCNAGYSGDGVTCNDVDECAASSTNNCNPARATCTNTTGSFTCMCNAGYSGDGVTCNDVNECLLNTDNCDDSPDACVNTAGGFTCSCPAGYGGGGVGASGCLDVDECAMALDNCDHMPNACVNTQGSYVCSCPIGYAGGGVGNSGCVDVDECLMNNGGCGSVSYYSCTNNLGAPPTCADINECLTNNGGCGSYNTCMNKIGAAPVCNDINECLTNNGNCGAASAWQCTNAVGAAPVCSDINECAAHTDNCSPYAICSNTAGSFSCACQCGYSGNGISCTQGPTILGYGPPPFAGMSSHSPNFLLGHQLVVPKATQLSRFGAVTNTTAGTHLILSLYKDNAGAPGALVAQAPSTTLVSGDNALAPTAPAIPLPAGTYWIMGEVDASTNFGMDSAGNVPIAYVSHTFGSGLPASFPAPSTYNGNHFNFYIVVYSAGFPPPAFTGDSSHSQDYLLGFRVQVSSTAALMRFGAVTVSANGSQKLQLALYADNAGVPGSLIAYSDPTTLALGDNALPVHRGNQCIAITPGVYWLMGIGSPDFHIGMNAAGGTNIRYVPLMFGSALPNPFPAASSAYTGNSFNYYINLQ